MHEQAVIDVRPILADGGCPFDEVMEAAQKLEQGDELFITAPFNPLPLYESLVGVGFDYHSKEQKNGAVTIRFRFTPLQERVLHADLDLRDLEPPQPMMKASEALVQAGIGHTLRIHTRFKPMHLLNSLAADSVLHESAEQEDGSWQTWLFKSGVIRCEH